jgi:hypothetical protein
MILVQCQGINADATQCSRICWIEKQEEDFLLDEHFMYCARHEIHQSASTTKTLCLISRPFSWKFIRQKICLAIICFNLALCFLFLGISFESLTSCIISLFFTCCSILCILLVFWHVYTNMELSNMELTSKAKAITIPSHITREKVANAA